MKKTINNIDWEAIGTLIFGTIILIHVIGYAISDNVDWLIATLIICGVSFIGCIAYNLIKYL